MNKPLNKKIIFACMTGTVFEFLDYTLYAFSIPKLAPQFFPSHDTTYSLFLAWCTFSISLLVRPFGTLFFGYLGDRIGRAKILRLTISLMSLSTICLGFLPTYNQIGLLAPLLLVLCRITQGLAISAEYNGGAIYLIETYPNQKGFVGSTIACGSGLGVFFAIIITLFFNTLGDLESITSSWRMCFIFSGLVAGIIGFYLRRKLPESQSFSLIKQNTLTGTEIIYKLLKNNKLKIASGIMISAYVGTAWYVLMVYIVSYLQNTLALTSGRALIITAVTTLLETALTLFFGRLSDRFGRVRVLALASTTMMILAVPLFMLISIQNNFLTVAILCIFSILLAAFDGPLASYIAEIFSTKLRFTGTALTYNIGCALIGGLAPTIITFLMFNQFGSYFPGVYLAFFAALALGSLYLLQRFTGEVTSEGLRKNEDPPYITLPS